MTEYEILNIEQLISYWSIKQVFYCPHALHRMWCIIKPTVLNFLCLAAKPLMCD